MKKQRPFGRFALRIENYFERVHQILHACLLIQLVFRYDNTGHHKKLKLYTYPHHKHAGSVDNVIESTAPDLASVLKEIEPLIPLS